MKDLNILLLLISSALCACTPKAVYSHFESVPMMHWDADSVLQFEVPVPDTTHRYDVLLCVRHTEAYPYQNMWLFTEWNGQVDTIEFYLADDHGRWLGNKNGKLIEMPVLYETSYQFTDTGYCTMRVQHGMREMALKGVSDVGIIIQRNGEE